MAIRSNLTCAISGRKRTREVQENGVRFVASKERSESLVRRGLATLVGVPAGTNPKGCVCRLRFAPQQYTLSVSSELLQVEQAMRFAAVDKVGVFLDS
jgi:hypothetical protein